MFRRLVLRLCGLTVSQMQLLLLLLLLLLALPCVRGLLLQV
jgi:hypothetical protein